MSCQTSRNVTAVIGYVVSPLALIVLKRRSDGGLAFAPAADVAWRDGSTYLPSAFLIAAVVNLFCSAYACSTYPTAPLVCLTQPATPSLPFAPVPVGHLTDLSVPGPLFQVDEYSVRNDVKFAVVPDSSERWQTVMFVLGSWAPEFWPAISGSFHFLTLPRKMSATVLPSSFRPCSTPSTLYETVTAPRTVGMWTGSEPFFRAVVISSSFIAASVAPKSTVPALNWAMPPPEPMAW